jgi:hypothetical protein
MQGMLGNYLPDEESDPDDFFAQVVPEPPPTDRPGGMLFMAPFGPALDGWFAYIRNGAHVDRFDGSQESVKDWARAQDVAERWILASDRDAYVPWPGPTGQDVDRRSP